MSLRRVVCVALLWALVGPAAAWAADDGTRLRTVLEGQFLSGVPHVVKAAEAVGGGPLGFVVEVPVNREDADEGAHRRRMQTLQARLTAQALALLERAFPGRSVASWSTVDLVEQHPEVAQVRKAPAAPRGAPWGGLIDGEVLGAAPITGAAPSGMTATTPAGPRQLRRPGRSVAGVDLAALDTLGSPGAAIPEAAPAPVPLVVPAPAPARPARAEPVNTALIGARMASLAPAMADRLRRELAPLYPDARVEVIPRAPRQVEVWITVLTQAPGSANGPLIVDYVKRLTEIVCSRDFADIEIVGGPNIGVRPLEDPDGGDLPRRDNGDWRSRPPRERVGLSRALEGRVRQELALRFRTVAVSVSFVDPHEAIFEVRAETAGALTPENRAAQREYMRRLALTILGNEHPDIKLSARSSFTVWTRTAHRPAAAGPGGVASVSAPITALRAKVVELPTAHVLHPGKRQVEVSAFHRQTGDGLFTNVGKYGLDGLELAYRQGLVHGLEMTLTYGTFSSAVKVRDPATFAAGSLGQGVLTGGLKCLVLRRSGAELSVGVTQSLVSDLDRAHFLPDEWERFANAYVAVSTPFAPRWRASAVALRSFIPASGPSDTAAVSVLGAAIEFLAFEEVRLAVEGVGERLSGASVGELGKPLELEGRPVFDNLHFNVSGTFGLNELGDVSVYGRKVNLADQREFGLTLFRRF